MESAAERAQRIRRLEESRAQRRASVDPGPWMEIAPLEVTEVAPGRGDLSWTSTSLDQAILNSSSSVRMVGRTVSFTHLFQSQPWIAAAVMRQLMWAIRVPLKVYRRTGSDSRVRLRPGDHPLADAVNTPWERGSMAQLTMNLLGPMLVHGNSVTQIQEGNRGSITFLPKDWRYAKPIMPWRDSIEGFKFDLDSRELAYEVSIDEILHMAWWSPAGLIGTSPLTQLGTTVSVEDAAQRYQEALFRNGARPPSAVTMSDEFLGWDRDEREAVTANLRSDITALYGGPDNSGRPALLPPGLDWKPIGQTTVEAALIDQRKAAREEVCAVYMIPPPMLGILDKATFSNIETQREMVYTECIGPPLVLIEQMLNAQLVQSLLREPDIYVEYDFAAVLRGDPLAQIASLRDAIGTAMLTPNESRSILNYEKSDNPAMDDFYLPTNNLSPIGSPATPRRLTVPPSNGQGPTGPRLLAVEDGAIIEVTVQ